jgi:hypothetical protein
LDVGDNLEGVLYIHPHGICKKQRALDELGDDGGGNLK